MKLSELQKILSDLKDKSGDIDIVLWGLDAAYYYNFDQDKIEIQRMADGTVRASIGISEWGDKREDEPTERPLVFTCTAQGEIVLQRPQKS